MIPEEHRPFIESHKLAIVGFARKSGPPSLSPVYYYLDGDEIVFSTTKTRGKGMAAARQGELTLCIVDMQPPFPYLTIFGNAHADEESAAAAMIRMAEVITGNALPDAARPVMEQRAASEGRVAIRVTPTDFVKTNPVQTRPTSS
jgi:PPOX class probable F420-dependent enzyme